MARNIFRPLVSTRSLGKRRQRPVFKYIITIFSIIICLVFGLRFLNIRKREAISVHYVEGQLLQKDEQFGENSLKPYCINNKQKISCSKNCKVYFMHIPKAGGTYFRHVLKNYGQSHGSFSWCQHNEQVYNCEMPTIPRSPEYRNQFTNLYFKRYQSQCSAVGSHSDYSLLHLIHQLHGIEQFMIVNVRKPFSRVVSLYTHLKYFRKAKLSDFETFAKKQVSAMSLQLVAEDCVMPQILHYQEPQLSSSEFYNLTLQEQKQKIFSRLEEFCVVLVQEHTQESTKLLSYAFNWDLPESTINETSGKIILKGQSQNLSKSQQLLNILKSTTTIISVEFDKANELDNYLYKAALNRFWWQYSQVPSST